MHVNHVAVISLLQTKVFPTRCSLEGVTTTTRCGRRSSDSYNDPTPLAFGTSRSLLPSYFSFFQQKRVNDSRKWRSLPLRHRTTVEVFEVELAFRRESRYVRTCVLLGGLIEYEMWSRAPQQTLQHLEGPFDA